MTVHPGPKISDLLAACRRKGNWPPAQAYTGCGHGAQTQKCRARPCMPLHWAKPAASGSQRYLAPLNMTSNMCASSGTAAPALHAVLTVLLPQANAVYYAVLRRASATQLHCMNAVIFAPLQ